MISVLALAKALKIARKSILSLRYLWLYHTGAAKAAGSMAAEVAKYRALQEQAKAGDAAELYAARMELRSEMTEAVYDRFRQVDRDVSELPGELHRDEQRSVLYRLHRAWERSAGEKRSRTHKNEQEL